MLSALANTDLPDLSLVPSPWLSSVSGTDFPFPPLLLDTISLLAMPVTASSSAQNRYDLCQLYDSLNLTGLVKRIERIVGGGGYCTVWQGEYNGEIVAVKVIREVGVSVNEETLRRVNLLK